MSVQAQWSLDSTSSSAVSISRGILRAATSDNVQPLAIIACERFGNTIAMSPEACLKIEKSVLPTPPPAVLRFVQGVVGYSADDCATQLGSTLAGLQFLGLAATLTTTLSLFDGATALQLMLKSSAVDKTLLPTTIQLRDLLASLEPRMHRSGFADDVVGWYLMLSDVSDMRTERRPLASDGGYSPSMEAVQNLVDCFRELHRIGGATAIKATIRVRSCAPWIIAFTKWCLGVPPSVYLDSGTPVIEQPASKVVIIVRVSEDSQKRDDMLVVTIEHSIGSPEDLLAPENHVPWGGMVTIEAYGQWFLRNRGLDQGDSLRVLHQCLPYATKAVLDALEVWDTFYTDPEISPRNVPKEFLAAPFTGDGPASEILARMLNSNTIRELQVLDTGMNVRDLLPVRQYLAVLRNDCHCHICANSDMAFSRCKQVSFMKDMSRFVATVVALSLFHCSDNLLVHLHHDIFMHNRFSDAVYYIVASEKDPVCSINSVFDWALSLVGHQMKDRAEHLPSAMSCYKGQAVYPIIFDQCRIRKQGYLALSWLPGLLKHSGDVYAHVWATREVFSHAPRHQVSSENVLRPVNLFSDFTLDWRITPRERFLELSVVLRSAEGGINCYITPWEILCGHARSLILESCSHSRDTPLKQAEPSCTYTSPYRPYSENELERPVVAVDGADHLRFFSMGQILYEGKRLTRYQGRLDFVFRIDACLECCLSLCKKAGYVGVVL